MIRTLTLLLVAACSPDPDPAAPDDTGTPDTTIPDDYGVVEVCDAPAAGGLHRAGRFLADPWNLRVPLRVAGGGCRSESASIRESSFRKELSK